MKGTPITEQMHRYIVDLFAPEDALLAALPAEADRLGIPQIHIDALQGKFLQVLMRACGAARAIEVGSLFGYSAIWMARALAPGGVVYALEINPLHARVIRDNAARAGLADRIAVVEGDAQVTLGDLRAYGPFDFAFIDADKPGYLAYYETVMTMLRPGAIIVADNMSAGGNAWDSNAGGSAPAIRALNARMAGDARLTALLTPVGDGMCVGVVNHPDTSR
jgi:predicted O-methyltransferase YrrM